MRWISFGVASVLLAVGLVWLIYSQHTLVEENRVEAEALKVEIEAGRSLVMVTPDLEREVIVQRETEEVIKEILSDDEEITNFVRTIDDYELASGISITQIRKQRSDNRALSAAPEDFNRVAYSISFDADAFNLLSFLDALESHKRFISVTAFKVSAAKRAQIDRGGDPRHSVTLNLETYVYQPKGGTEEIRIDGYERKRDLLLADIQKSADDLRVPVYDYQGPRGRRDPWIDPRLPIGDEGLFLSIEEQIEIVEELEDLSAEVESFAAEVAEAENLIAEMKARARMEEAMARLDEDLRRVQEQDQIVFGPSRKKLEGVVALLAQVREDLGHGPGGGGPSKVELEQVAGAVRRHLNLEEYTLALQAFGSIEPRLLMAERDPDKAALVGDLRSLAERARTVIRFAEIDMHIGGVAVMAGARPVALINGDSIVAGDYLDRAGELFVSDIRSHEIEFIFQGVTLIRRIDDGTPLGSNRN